MPKKPTALINLNTSDENILVTKLKIAPRLAKRIIALRPFTSVEQISQVWGIDQQTIDRITPLIYVDTLTSSELEVLPITELSDESTGQQTPTPNFDNDKQSPEPDTSEEVFDEEVNAEKSERKIQPISSAWKTNLLILFILLFGAYFRFTGLNWDDNHHQHPDERFISMIAEQIRPVKSIAMYFDTQNSTLNPIKYGSYTYGMLPLFITRTVAEWLEMTDYDRVTLVGRAMSGLFDLAACWMLYILAKRLFNKKTGVLAAGLYAAAVFPIQMSHFFTVDTFATVFILISIYFAYDIFKFDQPTFQLKWKSLYLFAVFGALVGLAGACKINALPVYGMIILAGIAYLLTNLSLIHI